MATVQSPTQDHQRQKYTRCRGGCNRCRRRRQKCDQQRPSCGRCTQAGVDGSCRYEVKLSWGGRAFGKSSFGKYLSNIEKRDTAAGDHGFVYCMPRRQPSIELQPPPSTGPTSSAAAAPPPPPSTHGNDTTDQAYSSPGPTGHAVVHHEADVGGLNPDLLEIDPEVDADRDSAASSSTALTTTSLRSVQFLPPMAHQLLQFYLTETMRLTVPSSYARTEMCRFLVPMSMHQPSLLHAIMAFAAVHLEATGRLSRADKMLTDTFHSTSIRHLRRLLDHDDPSAQAVALATARTLCQAQIYGGTSSWRVHLNGARAIIESSQSWSYIVGSDRPGPTPNISFLSSWFNNAEALAALSPTGLLHGQLQADGQPMPAVYFDMFAGAMSDLPDLFREVGALVKESRRQRHNRPPQRLVLSEADITHEAGLFIQEIHARLQRDSFENMAVNPNMALAFSEGEIHDYALSNAGFLYTALLHVHCGALATSPTDAAVKSCVTHIIRCAQDMTSASGLSPRVLLVAPLFTAGLCATGPAQDSVRAALTDIGRWMRTPHLTKTLSLLEQFWESSLADAKTSHVWSWFDKINFDFLPY